MYKIIRKTFYILLVFNDDDFEHCVESDDVMIMMIVMML